MLDPAQLNSRVIRVFNFRCEHDQQPSVDDVTASDVDFCAHVIVEAGIYHKMWSHYGHKDLEDSFTPPRFMDCDEEDPAGDNPIFPKSDNWVIWTAGDDYDMRRRIGERVGKYQNIDLGLIMPPVSILMRMESGSYSMPYFT